MFTIIIMFLFSGTTLLGSSHSQSYMTESKKEYINQIQTNIYLDNFTTSHVYADSLIEKYKYDPIGYVFKAATYLSEMTFHEDNFHAKEFKKLIDTSYLLSKQNLILADSNIVAWNYLCLGHALAYNSLYESRFGSMAKALKDGYSAKKAYDNGLRYDSSVYDLYGGLGMFHYWKSAKAGFLRWIHIIHDDLQRGIDELHLTIDSSLVSSDAAKSSLIWIFLDAKMYDSALVTAQGLQNKYPEGRMFSWGIAQTYFKSEQYEKAIEIYQELLDKQLLKKENYYNIIECEFQIYDAYKKSKNQAMAKTIAKRFIRYVNKIPYEIRKKQRDKIKKLLKDASN